MKGAQAQEPGSDIRMQIAVASTGGLGVIQMQGAQMLQAHDVVEFLQEGLEAGWCD